VPNKAIEDGIAKLLQPDEQAQVPDLAQSIRVMPEVASKLGSLGERTISAVRDAYGLVNEVIQLGITQRWRDMSWRERVRWLRSTG
jgi:hypothetical protein